MNKVFEKIVEKLEELHERYINQYGAVGGNPMAFSVKECMEIVQEVAEEYNNGWIPCSERLPEKNKYIKVWLSFTNNICSFVKRAIWYGSHFEYENGKVVSDTPTAWMQYYEPEPYQPKGE